MSGKDEIPITIILTPTLLEKIHNIMVSREYCFKCFNGEWDMREKTIMYRPSVEYPKEYWEQSEKEFMFFNDIRDRLNNVHEDFGRQKLLNMANIRKR